ncbi:ABC transporter permease EcsB [Staphylococcus capitis]|uniref:ABC transporter permease EcsB n=1 Tax=Staphylococcus capitis TaxID=29388 RepID=UPI00064B26F2|nr:ABC transporter permease [Staphylococcus capitis]AKL92220.1 putative ABC-type exoprotein transport system, permease component [Staphylococcus capitis subsp. capitis]MCC0831045.1 ABC transporter permease [Staphylococcus capitis]MCC3743560.1 ABC transporter permease [Staphylococcus capitis]MCC9116446.1 ABC transporter permease [Staphylococcus capitis]MCC9143249.1 ABC transporter permease [Staphylococcus capitis]
MNNQSLSLFNRRYKAIRKEKSYYNKFIFNGHFTVFLLILLGAFIFGYGEWLQHIPQHINYALFASIAVALVSLFPIRTLLKDADKIFLLPFEKHMKDYMQVSLIYSYSSRIFLQVILLIILFPLFYKLNDNHFAFYIVFAISAIIFPYLGLLVKWQWLKLNLSSWTINLLLFVLFGITFYLILRFHNYFAIIFIFIVGVLLLILKMNSKKQLFPWERMIAIEQQKHTNYYKFVNMFTDVKHLRESAVRRSYLDFILPTPKGNKFNENRMYLFLFVRSFVRGRDAFSIILRLVIIALVLMLWLSNPIVSLIIGSLFMYITLLQMAQFYTQQAYGLWPQVWPVSDTKVIKGYEQFLYRLMIGVGIIFTIVFVIKHPTLFFFALLFFIVGWLTIRSTIKKLKYQETLLRD